ncbi:MAG TPA: guanylate kinase [Bacteroidales bacterium]|nr:guanylate kinase [Bacteroidales bacterium]HQK36272.1 guanylate kinase [Bacteroidales bacterium]
MNSFQGKAIIVSAPSGAGKTTIVHRLLESGLPLGFSVSATSRPRRMNEVNGVDYFFLTPDEFMKKVKNGDFIEWEEVYENQYYGTLKSEIERLWQEKKHALFDVDVKGGISLKKYFGTRALAIFIKPPSLQILNERLKARGTETEESLKKRMAKAEFELSFAPGFDAVVENDILEKAVDEVYRLVAGFIGAVK